MALSGHHKAKSDQSESPMREKQKLEKGKERMKSKKKGVRVGGEC